MESVHIRQRGAYDFESHYDSVCALHDCCPLPAVKAHLSQGILDLNGDKISLPDWKPLLSSLSINKSLEYVAVTSNHLIAEKGKENNVPKSKRKQPAIRGKEGNHELCKAIKKCLLVTPALACLKLQGLPLRDSDILYLAKGLNKNCSLNYLSLTGCRIGDNGLETIGRAIKNNMTLNAINLTGCSLTWQGADIFARIIKHQAMCRHGEAWKDSLRYRRPDLERMSGLRRITLNNNPLIGDHGALVLAEALRDDLWLKALDLQGCGISKVGAKAFSDMLSYNTTLVVLDVRANPMIDRSIIHSIIEQVMLNSKAIDTENSEPQYDWIKLECSKVGQKPKRKKGTKTINNSFTKKTSIKINGMRYHLKTSRSSSSQQGKVGSNPTEITQPSRGIPWRTAARAIKQRGCFSSHEEYYGPDGSVQIIADPDPQQMMPVDQVHTPPTEKKLYNDKKIYQVLSPYNSQDNANIANGISMLKNLKVELEHAKRELCQERQARQEADKNVLELTLENERLLVEIEQLRNRNSLLNDEKVLEAIETSFKQFHAFLDVLRQAGLGELIRVAGLDEKSLLNPPEIPSQSQRKTQLSDVHNRRSPFSKSPFADDVTLTDFRNQDKMEREGYAYSFPLSYGHQDNIVSSPDIKKMTGGQKSFLCELTPESPGNIPENSKDLNSTFGIDEQITEYGVPVDINTSQQEPQNSDDLLTRFDQKDLQRSFHLWEKSKTLVSGSILTKPADPNTKTLMSSPSSPKSVNANYWLEGSFNRAKITEDILKKTRLKQDKESDPRVCVAKVAKAGMVIGRTNMQEEKVEDKENWSKNGNVEKVAKLSVLQNKDSAERMKKKEMFADSEATNLNQVEPENKSGSVSAVEMMEVRDLAENLASHERASDRSLNTRENTEGPKSLSLRTEATEIKNGIQHLSKKAEDISGSQEMSFRNKEKPEEVLSGQLKNIPVLADSNESKVTSDTDDSFSLGTLDLPQVSNQCDTPAHSSTVKLDSIPGLDDMNSQDTSPFKSMSDEDF